MLKIEMETQLNKEELYDKLFNLKNDLEISFFYIDEEWKNMNCKEARKIIKLKKTLKNPIRIFTRASIKKAEKHIKKCSRCRSFYYNLDLLEKQENRIKLKKLDKSVNS